jgi:hypothetical protein
MMPIVKTIVYWTWMLNLLEDPNTNLLYHFFLNLTLIYPTLNLNLCLPVINKQWVQWRTMQIEGKWLGAMAQKEDNTK